MLKFTAEIQPRCSREPAEVQSRDAQDAKPDHANARGETKHLVVRVTGRKMRVPKHCDTGRKNLVVFVGQVAHIEPFIQYQLNPEPWRESDGQEVPGGYDWTRGDRIYRQRLPGEKRNTEHEFLQVNICFF